MSYKTILVHCNDERRMQRLLVPAVQLAEAFQSHLIALSVVPPVSVISAGPPNGPPIVLDEHCKAYRERNPALKSAFEAATRGRSLVGDWREDEADAFGIAARRAGICQGLRPCHRESKGCGLAVGRLT